MLAYRDVPVYKPLITDDEIKASEEALRNGWLGMGSYVRDFESEIERIIDSPGRHAVAVSTGHAALHLALMLNNIGVGDEVLTPSFNNIADFQAIIATGARPVFCDVSNDTLTIDVEKAERLISANTKAVIILDYNFFMAPQKQIRAMAEKHGLIVIHDAAHSIGSTCEGRPIGSTFNYTMFSFDAVKTFTCIDGGVLIVTNEREKQLLQEMRLIGQGQPPALLYQNKREWRYDVHRLGFRYHMANLHAAVGLAQLKKRDVIQRTRLETCRYYSDELSDVEGIEIPRCDFVGVNPFMYHIRVVADKRDEFRAFLADHGVGTGIHWQPGHWFSLFSDCRKGDLSITNRIGKEIVTLPFHSCMDPEDRGHVVAAIREFFIKGRGAGRKS